MNEYDHRRLQGFRSGCRLINATQSNPWSPTPQEQWVTQTNPVIYPPPLYQSYPPGGGTTQPTPPPTGGAYASPQQTTPPTGGAYASPQQTTPPTGSARSPPPQTSEFPPGGAKINTGPRSVATIEKDIADVESIIANFPTNGDKEYFEKLNQHLDDLQTELREATKPPFGGSNAQLKDVIPPVIPNSAPSFLNEGNMIRGAPIPPPDGQLPLPPTPAVEPPLPPVAPPAGICPSMHPTHSFPGVMSQAGHVQSITDALKADGKLKGHDPDGIHWLGKNDWVSWVKGRDASMPPTAANSARGGLLYKFIFPTPNHMRGLRDRFYEVRPFADNLNPTVAEIENWNIEVIRHYRSLMGFSEATHPVSNNKCQYLKAAWSTERYHTDKWNALYPGEPDNPERGPCALPFDKNAHCGGGFVPEPQHQVPYWCPNPMAACTRGNQTEGTQNAKIVPWSIMLSRIIHNFYASDGIDAHTGPFGKREFFGSSWWRPAGGDNVVFRGKWSGNQPGFGF